MIRDIIPKITEIRHTIHQYPEIAGKEYKTSELVKKQLSSLDVNILPPFLETDIVAMMKGKGNGKNVALRADMDALPLQELTDLPYASKINGMMHACGHDGNTAVLLGVATILNKLKSSFNGSVRFIFQPGEESVALGKDLVEAGVLLNPKPDAVFAMHASPQNDFGVIASRIGVMYANSDAFMINIIGKGGHGSTPHLAKNPIDIGVQICGELQKIIPRNFNAVNTIVLSICQFKSGNASNVIPETSEIKGTVRTLSKEISNKMQENIKKVVENICNLYDVKYEIKYNQNYIPVVTDPDSVALGEKITKEVLGFKWEEMRHPTMGGEDFAYYLEDYPGAMFRIGMGKDVPLLHNSHFDYNDDALFYGILLLVSTTLESLNLEKAVK